MFAGAPVAVVFADFKVAEFGTGAVYEVATGFPEGIDFWEAG